VSKVVEHNNASTENIEAAINDTHIPGEEPNVRDTSSIDINDIDTSNVTHIENETSPDLVGDFVNELELMVSASNLNDRIN
jgi:hypothetical protein